MFLVFLVFFFYYAVTIANYCEPRVGVVKEKRRTGLQGRQADTVARKCYYTYTRVYRSVVLYGTIVCDALGVFR